jgi:hypothetical protein
MGTNHGVLGDGRVRGVVACGKLGQGPKVMIDFGRAVRRWYVGVYTRGLRRP